MYQGLDQGAAALEYLNEQMPIDKIEAIMERTDEALEDRQAIDDFLNNSELLGEKDFYQGVEDEMDKMMAEDPDLKQAEPSGKATLEKRGTEEKPVANRESASESREAASLPAAPHHEPRVTRSESNEDQEAVAS